MAIKPLVPRDPSGMSRRASRVEEELARSNEGLARAA
jgi:hypothetical protein